MSKATRISSGRVSWRQSTERAPASSTRARLLACVLLIAATPLLLPNRWIHRAPAFATSLAPSYGDVGNLEIGFWLRDHTPADASVADYWAASVFYYSGRRGVDLLGKMDPSIARMPANGAVRCAAALVTEYCSLSSASTLSV